MTPTSQNLANALRILAMDGVQAANSGHPGMPLGMAEIAVALWHRHLRHNPSDPKWPNRDRFVLSNGHGSMLLYALLHLTGYDLPLEALKRFRQWHSKTPGHPEYGYTPGVETTTGPLGQGLANAVGFALAERLLAAHFNRDGYDLVDHHTYVFLGDGCMMEGISHEVCALAGVWKLGKLIALYDDNGISIDGHVAPWFADNTPARFEAYGWNVIPAVDGHDVDAVDAAIRQARAQCDRPTLICCRTVIGKGSPNKAGTHDVHGAPLGGAEIAATRQALGITAGPFEIDDALYAAWDGRELGAQRQREWVTRFADYRRYYPELAAEFERRMAGDLPDDFTARAAAVLDAAVAKAETLASRKASQNTLDALAPTLPELLGGSADLAPSNLTMWRGCQPVREGWGNYLNYGVREFGMAAIMNGVVLHGGFRPYGGTFLMFSEYARNAIRMAALMRINPIYVFTHDGIGVGEDGPTHQPIEQTATLRMVPNLDVWRPCDTVETVVAWRVALMHRHTPTALILSRQNLACQTRTTAQIADIARGGYVLCAAEHGEPKAVILATGSEVEIAVAARAKLGAQGIDVSVVSMPSPACFDQQDAGYRRAVLPPGIPRVAVEAGVTDYWRKYVGLSGAVIGIDHFGESAPASVLYEKFGVTAEAVAAAVLERLEG